MMMLAAPAFSIVRKTEVLRRLGIKKTTLHLRIKANLFPPPFPLGGRAVGWFEYELTTMLQAYGAGKSHEVLNAQVEDLIKRRALNQEEWFTTLPSGHQHSLTIG